MNEKKAVRLGAILIYSSYLVLMLGFWIAIFLLFDVPYLLSMLLGVALGGFFGKGVMRWWKSWVLKEGRDRDEVLRLAKKYRLVKRAWWNVEKTESVGNPK